MTLAEQQTEQIAHAVLRSQRGDWPENLAQALRMGRLATTVGEAQQMLLALRVIELCREAETKQRNAGRL